jgi:hypothetical protein
VRCLDVLEYCLPGGLVGGPRLSVQQFGFDGREERLGDRVVPALTAPAHRQADAVSGGEAGMLGAGVLTAAIGMKDQPGRGPAPHESVGEGLVDQVGLEVIGDGPADDAA